VFFQAALQGFMIRLLPSRMRVVKWENDRLHKDFESVEVNREKAKACNVLSN
jgi:hypothetical protein